MTKKSITPLKFYLATSEAVNCHAPHYLAQSRSTTSRTTTYHKTKMIALTSQISPIKSQHSIHHHPLPHTATPIEE